MLGSQQPKTLNILINEEYTKISTLSIVDLYGIITFYYGHFTDFLVNNDYYFNKGELCPYYA